MRKIKRHLRIFHYKKLYLETIIFLLVIFPNTLPFLFQLELNVRKVQQLYLKD